MERLIEYFLKPFLLIGGLFTISMYLSILLLRILFLGTSYAMLALSGIYLIFFVLALFASYFNFRLSKGEVSRRKLRIKNQIMFNMPMLVFVGFMSGNSNYMEHTSVGASMIAGNLVFFLVNLLVTFLVLKFFKSRKVKVMEDVIDYEN